MSNCVGTKKELFASAARTATATSAPKSLPDDAKDVGIVINTTAFTSGTFTAKLQTSSDGTNWTDITGATSSAVGAVGQSYGFASVACFPLVRCVLTGASTPIATNQVFLVYGTDK